MILRNAPCDVSRTRHPLGRPGRPGSRVVPVFSTRQTAVVARGRGFVVGVLD